MSTNLTADKIKDSFNQLLHVDGGPEAAEKIVYSGTGVATALKLGTGSASVENIQLNGNTISTLDTDGSLVLAPNGSGSVSIVKVAFSDAAQARTALGLGTMATQNASAVAIADGTVEATTLSTSATSAGVNLNGNTLAADGISTNIDINITPKGTGIVKAPRLLATASVGYTTGSGGIITQITSRTTGVTLNAPSGQITLVAANLAVHDADEFTLTNSFIAATDIIVINIASGAAAGTRRYYHVGVVAVAAGSCVISVGNIRNAVTPPTGTEAPVLTFAIIKGVIT